MILDIFKTHMTDGLCRTLPVLFSVFPRKMFAPQTWDCQIFADVPSISQGNDRGEKRSNIQIVILDLQKSGRKKTFVCDHTNISVQHLSL